jgi:hypothetical protein|tara:strand:- start:203 stop:1360 length:1158 start_codon:yes stop_codon:yes gene_type:complete
MSEEINETPSGELAQGEFKIKKKMKKLVPSPKDVAKVDMAKEEPKKEIKTEETKVEETKVDNVKVEEPIIEKTENETDSPIEEVEIEDVEKEIEKTKEIVSDIKEEIKANPQIDLPENVEKLVSFMKETGGNVEDYVRLNKDYSKLEGEDLLKEYYSVSKPHLDNEDIDNLIDDNFAWEEDTDEKTVRQIRLAYKEEIAKAKSFLQSSKDKYYEEIKLRPSVSQEQKQANDFFNRYNDEQQVIAQRHERFANKTKDLFSDEFKGFEYRVGDKAFRYNVNNKNDVASNQTDLNNFVGKFLDKKGEINDYKGYHKALYTANNADKLAQHFYEQGKTDAIKDLNAKSKNITNEVRATSSGEMFINGMKIKAISGVDSSKLKIKKHNSN